MCLQKGFIDFIDNSVKVEFQIFMIYQNFSAIFTFYYAHYFSVFCNLSTHKWEGKLDTHIILAFSKVLHMLFISHRDIIFQKIKSNFQKLVFACKNLSKNCKIWTYMFNSHFDYELKLKLISHHIDWYPFSWTY